MGAGYKSENEANIEEKTYTNIERDAIKYPRRIFFLIKPARNLAITQAIDLQVDVLDLRNLKPTLQLVTKSENDSALLFLIFSIHSLFQTLLRPQLV